MLRSHDSRSTALSATSSERSATSVISQFNSPLSPYNMEARSHKVDSGLSRDNCKLVKLICKHRWLEFSNLLSSVAAREKEVTLSSKTSSNTMGTGTLVHVTYSDYRYGNLLHVLCQHHPPSKLVHKVATLYPLLVIHVNRCKQTPLHVAAAYGASHRVIAMLLRHSMSAAIMQDDKGRTPLHLHIEKTTSRKICDSLTTSEDDNMYLEKQAECKQLSQSSKDKDEKVLCAGPDVKVMRRLSETSPASLDLRDQNGQTPVDMAMSMGPQKIEMFLVEAMQRIRKRHQQGATDDPSAPDNNSAAMAVAVEAATSEVADYESPAGRDKRRSFGSIGDESDGVGKMKNTASSKGQAARAKPKKGDAKKEGTMSLNRYLRKVGMKRSTEVFAKHPRSKSERLGKIQDGEDDNAE